MDFISPNSYWSTTSDAGAADYPKLESDLRTEVAIIGGGITGLTAALHLLQAGRRVVIFEAGRIGAGTTGGTSGRPTAPSP